MGRVRVTSILDQTHLARYFPSNMTPFELLFGRKPRTSLDSLVPLSEETGQRTGLDNFVERRKQNLR